MKGASRGVALAISILAVLTFAVVVPDSATAVPSLCDSIAGNLVTNCGFESGNFAGWTNSGNPGFTSVRSDAAHTGNFGADFGPVGSDGFISQVIPTIPGAQYRFEAWERSDGFTPNHFDMEWGSTTLVNETNHGAHGYQLYSFLVTATDPSTQIRFSFRNDPGFDQFDDVSLVLVPEAGSLLLVGAGLAAAGFRTVRRRRNS